MVKTIKTTPLYWEDSKLLKCQAKVISVGSQNFKGKKVDVVNFDKTIFHPQGGGQPADTGFIGGIKVYFVAKRCFDSIDNFEVDHIFLNTPFFKVGEEVLLEVNKEDRYLHMRLHTAGHAIAHYVEQLFPQLKATRGHHFPQEASIRFQGKLVLEKLIFAKQIERLVNEGIANKVPAKILKKGLGNARMLQIGKFDPVPCGGVHVENLSELRGIRIRSVKFKNEEVTLGYDVID